MLSITNCDHQMLPFVDDISVMGLPYLVDLMVYTLCVTIIVYLKPLLPTESNLSCILAVSITRGACMHEGVVLLLCLHVLLSSARHTSQRIPLQ